MPCRLSPGCARFCINTSSYSYGWDSISTAHCFGKEPCRSSCLPLGLHHSINTESLFVQSHGWAIHVIKHFSHETKQLRKNKIVTLGSDHSHIWELHSNSVTTLNEAWLYSLKFLVSLSLKGNGNTYLSHGGVGLCLPPYMVRNHSSTEL